MSKTKQSTQQTVLEALATQPAMTVAELAAVSGISRSTISTALTRLEGERRVRRETGPRNAGRRTADRWSTMQRARTKRWAEPGERLRPGQLDTLVLDYLDRHRDAGPLGPTEIANGLERSSGAVANCLTRLVATGRARKTSNKPRRYRLR